MKLPVVIERGEDGFYVVECPLLRGCYTQGRTLEEALQRLKEVINLCLEEIEKLEIAKDYNPEELTFSVMESG